MTILPVVAGLVLTTLFQVSDPGYERWPAPTRVVAEHHCTDACEHAWDGRGWVSLPGHRHRGACGHVYAGHIFVFGGPHGCSERCDHAWDGHAWIVDPGHRHGPGCGHGLQDGRWVVLAAPAPLAGHRCSPSCSHTWTGERWTTDARHRHQPGCGHELDAGRWVQVRFAPSRRPGRAAHRGCARGGHSGR